MRRKDSCRARRGRGQCGRTLALCGALALAAGHTTRADNIFWQGNGGDWSTANNWLDYSQPNGQGGYLNQVPGSADSAYIQNGKTAQIGGAASTSSLQIDNGSSLNQSGSLSVGANEYVGYNGTGNFNQTGGTHTVNGTLFLARYAGSAGSYTLSGSAILSASTENIGTWTGYTVQNQPVITNPNGPGSFTQNGGFNFAGTENVGFNTTGIYNQSGGTNTVTVALAVGAANGNGVYNLSGTGTINAYSEIIGNWYDTGAFTQSSGTTNAVATQIIVGNWGNGSYVQTGGQTSVAGPLFLAGNSWVTGSYALSGSGILSTSTIVVGGWSPSSPGGTGTLSISGGTAAASAALQLCSTTSQVNLSNGSLTVGTLSVYAGTFTQTGGTFAATSVVQSGGLVTLPSVTLAGSGGNAPAYNLSAGTLATPSLTVAPGGSFTWSGGTLDITPGGSGYSGPALTVPSGGTLKGTGSLAAALAILSGGTLAPGNSPGILSTDDIAFATNSDLLILLDGTTPGSQYAQLNVTGAVNLDSDLGSGSLLNLVLGYAPTIGDSYTIINNDGTDPITGTFANLPEGGVFSGNFNGNSYFFQVSYTGGTGNDVVLTSVVPEPASISLLALGAITLLRRRRTV